MSFDTRKERVWSRCLFCSLRCPIGVNTVSPGQPVVDFPQGIHGGICARGYRITDLIRSPARTSRTIHSTANSPADTFEYAKNVIKDADRINLIVDANQSGHVLGFASAVMSKNSTIKSYLAAPGEDILLLHNAWASSAPTVTLEDLHGIDGLLIVGDPFITHPQSAGKILDLTFSGIPSVVLDIAPSKTGQFATIHVRVKPADQPDAFAHIVGSKERPEHFQSVEKIDSTDHLRAAIDMVSKYETAGVIIASSPGRGIHWPYLGFLGGRFCAETKGKFVVLTRYGNAATAARFLAWNHLLPIGELSHQSSENTVTIVVGDGGFRMAPRHVRKWTDDSSDIIQLSVFPSRDFNGIHIPTTLFVEEDRIDVAREDSWETARAVVAPPAGIRSTHETLVALLRDVVNLGDNENPETLAGHPVLPVPEISDSLPIYTDSESEFMGVLIGTPDQFVHGILTDHSSFRFATHRLPAALFSSKDADALNIVTGDVIVLTSSYGSCNVVAEVVSHQRPGWIAVPEISQSSSSIFNEELVDGLAIFAPTPLKPAHVEKR